MAEERILIEYYRPIKELNDGSEDRIMNQLTRAEAIEKMAKALYEHQYQKTRPLWEDEDNGYKEIYLNRAEAALNALLGEK